MLLQFAFWIAFILLGVLPQLLGAQQPPSCEDQLAEVQATLSFVRASRQSTEETAGRVTVALQKRLDASLKDVEKLQHPPAVAPEPTKDMLHPQKDDAS